MCRTWLLLSLVPVVSNMGNCCSAPKTKAPQQQERQYTTAAGESLQGKDSTKQSKKVGLSGQFQAVKLLGRGAAADIWLFRDLKHGNQVAVKLFERPLPQGAMQAVLREIKVVAEIRLAPELRSKTKSDRAADQAAVVSYRFRRK